MIRKQIYVTERHKTYLSDESARLQITEAELFRRMLDAYIDTHVDNFIMVEDAENKSYLKE